MKYIEILEKVNPNWSIKEKARKVYYEIAKKSKYDERFAYGLNQDLLHAIYYRQIDVEQEEDPRMVCRTINEVYYQLLERLGIRAKMIDKDSKVKRPIEVKDTALIFWDENGDKYYTNIVADIENCRFGMKTVYFGRSENLYEEAQDVKEISEEELKQIDLKTGCIKSDYNDIVFRLLADEVKNTGHFKRFLRGQGIDANKLCKEEILEYKLHYLNKLIKFRDRTAGADEHKRFYKKLFCSSALDKFDSKKFKVYEFVKEEGEEIDIASVIELDLPGKLVYYMYSKEEQTYIQCQPEKIMQKISLYRERKGKRLLIEQRKQQEQEDDYVY